MSARPGVRDGELALKVEGRFVGGLVRMRASHAASKCSMLSVAHALDEVACSRVGLAEKPKDERSDAAERAETRDEGTEFKRGGLLGV